MTFSYETTLDYLLKALVRLGSALLLVVLVAAATLGQTEAIVKGRIASQSGESLADVKVSVPELRLETKATSSGSYYLKVPSRSKPYTFVFSYIGYVSQNHLVVATEAKQISLDISLLENQAKTKDVEISEDANRYQVSSLTINPQLAKVLPSPFGDFNRLLALMPGVIANNELSSGYSVRGGNYDENLVYVNDMEIYRPQLVRAGQQEGLSFVNPDLVKNVSFSAGGWQPRHGDKMGSVLDVEYKKPEKWGSNISATSLVQSISLDAGDTNSRWAFVTGFRRKNAAGLFGRSILGQGFDVTGEYFPRFIDWQSHLSYDLSPQGQKGRTTIGLISSYADNRYRLVPASRETDYGTLTNKLRFTVAFAGMEELRYRTWQQGLKLSHKWSEKAKTHVTISYVLTREQEVLDEEAGYRLCDVQSDPNRSNFNQCIADRGIGTLYSYARNVFGAKIFNGIARHFLQWNDKHFVEIGGQFSYEQIQDRLYEYGFVDSADFVRVNPPIQASHAPSSFRYQAYIQDSWSPSQEWTITYGLRLNYWTLNGQMLLSPRLQASWRPDWERDFVFRVATGRYVQPAFYRELRNSQGQLNPSLRAQQSWHWIAGVDYQFKLWNRDFKWTTEVYYKRLTDVVAYDVENVRIRYFANNQARAYAMGMDTRLAGEFVSGVESWFGLSLLNTKEDIAGDSRGYYRRPTDQRITFTSFFQDHLPGNPSVRAYLSLIVGSGLPFSVPGDINQRSAFIGPSFRRVDIGTSKIVSLGNGQHPIGRHISMIQIGVDLLNVLGSANTISYTWIKDVNNQQFAIPNTLSMRFLSFKLLATLK